MENIFSQIINEYNNFDFRLALFVFIAYILVDGLYAKYTIDVTRFNAYKAATTGTIIHFLLAFGVINYTQNWLYVFPLAVGSWIGTFWTVRKEKEKIKKIKK